MDKINERRKVIDIETLEITDAGNSNGISTQLKSLIEKGEHRSLNVEEKQTIIDNATKAYADFLTALGCDWENDPNSAETPKRVAKAFVNDLWRGRYELPTDITAFPSDGYSGIVLEMDIPIISQC